MSPLGQIAQNVCQKFLYFFHSLYIGSWDAFLDLFTAHIHTLKAHAEGLQGESAFTINPNLPLNKPKFMSMLVGIIQP